MIQVLNPLWCSNRNQGLKGHRVSTCQNHRGVKIQRQNRIKQQNGDEEIAKTYGRRQVFFPVFRKLTQCAKERGGHNASRDNTRDGVVVNLVETRPANG